MKFLGSKYIGTDSSICIIDITNKEIFAISTERVTRVKHDELDIGQIFKKINFKHNYFQEFSVPFNDFSNKDFSLPTKYLSFFLILYRLIFGSFIKQKFLEKPLFHTKQKKSILKSEFLRNYIQNLFIVCRPLNYFFSKNSIKLIGYIYNLKFKKIKFYDHHLCHAASAYYFSPYAYSNQDVLSVTLDGMGDGYWSKVYVFNDQEYNCVSKSPVSSFRYKILKNYSSLGEIYSEITNLLGFKRNSDEGKVEALAAYGKINKNFYNFLQNTIFLNNLNFNIDKNNIKYFYSKEFKNNLRILKREDIAKTIQSFLEDIVVKFLNKVYERYEIKYLCLSGGITANIIMNLNIYEKCKFKKIYIFPAMGDEGSSIGSAILSSIDNGNKLDWLKNYDMPYFGEKYSKKETLIELSKFKKFINYYDLSERWTKDAALEISKSKVVSVFNEKMEFGPRALGNRSVLANPINPEMRNILNSKIKNRPLFQPFCPSILESERLKLFEKSFYHKHMAIAFRLKKEFYKKLPSLIHTDGTARPQFVSEEDNYFFHMILTEFKKITGYGTLINTSFNLHGRTIVRTPKDAIIDFIDCKIDVLYLNGYKVIRR